MDDREWTNWSFAQGQKVFREGDHTAAAGPGASRIRKVAPEILAARLSGVRANFRSLRS